MGLCRIGLMKLESKPRVVGLELSVQKDML